MTHQTAQRQSEALRSGSPLIGAIRIGLGVVAVVAAVLGGANLAFGLVLGLVIGGDDDYQRMLLGSGLVVAGLCLLSAFLLSSWSFRDVMYSRALRMITLVFGLAVVWGAFGIDSTRPLREMPEASMEVPGARETAVQTYPARSSIEVGLPAKLERAFESDGPAPQIEAFFVRTLPPRGWTYSGESDRGLEWKRDGYLFQLRLSDPNEPWPGGFSDVSDRCEKSRGSSTVWWRRFKAQRPVARLHA